MAKNSPDSGYPDGDHLNGGDPKAFYENLPFHGAPLKQVSHTAPTGVRVKKLFYLSLTVENNKLECFSGLVG